MSQSMRKSLEKQSAVGAIEFHQTEEREFYIRDLKTGKLSRIFYDNKYRQDTLDRGKALHRLDLEIEEKLKGVNDIGIYNTEPEVRKLRNLRNFLDN